MRPFFYMFLPKYEGKRGKKKIRGKATFLAYKYCHEARKLFTKYL